MAVTDQNVPKNITASTNIRATQGTLAGFYVNSTSSGTMVIYDDASTGTTTPVSGTITPAVGWHRFPASFANGIYIVVGGTLNVTVFHA